MSKTYKPKIITPGGKFFSSGLEKKRIQHSIWMDSISMELEHGRKIAEQIRRTVVRG